MNDTIYRQAAIDTVEHIDWYHLNARGEMVSGANTSEHQAWYKADDVYKALEDLPSAQPERLTDDDLETIRIHLNAFKGKLCNQRRWEEAEEYQRIIDRLMAFATAQPERTCVNCGRTVNNGGWYADGGTRCPIEEHYALPKDGYCHLWEKRNITDDDYPERRTDE